MVEIIVIKEERKMKEALKFVHCTHEGKLASTEAFGLETAKKARAYHRSFPEYRPMPFVDLKNLAERLGVTSIHVKDESGRFGLSSFKVLGGSYALGSYLADKLGIELDYQKLTDPGTREKLGEITFVTTTDGNHGRGIAWTANRLKQRAVVYMPAGSSEERLSHIKDLGAGASITEYNYDDTRRLASAVGDARGWVHIQDTTGEGVREAPLWCMQGYTTMVDEAVEQLRGEKPTHVFLQAGAGSLAGAVVGYLVSRYGKDRPVITIVEPNKADCIYRSARAGKPVKVTGDMHTIMAGLACGELCAIAWEILRDYADNFVSMPDWYAAKGVRVLGNPLGDDPRIVSGESGAAPMGFLMEVLTNPNLEEIRETIGLDATSRILLFSTEGDTDRESYRSIVWDGLYPSF